VRRPFLETSCFRNEAGVADPALDDEATALLFELFFVEPAVLDDLAAFFFPLLEVFVVMTDYSFAEVKDRAQ
jgi:hypothetical protein